MNPKISVENIKRYIHKELKGLERQKQSIKSGGWDKCLSQKELLTDLFYIEAKAEVYNDLMEHILFFEDVYETKKESK